jgi:hypothetical protein
MSRSDTNGTIDCRGGRTRPVTDPMPGSFRRAIRGASHGGWSVVRFLRNRMSVSFDNHASESSGHSQTVRISEKSDYAASGHMEWPLHFWLPVRARRAPPSVVNRAPKHESNSGIPGARRAIPEPREVGRQGPSGDPGFARTIGARRSQSASFNGCLDRAGRGSPCNR